MDFFHVITFFLKRKKADGGYGASPKLPATIEDTYYAFRSLSTLETFGIEVPSDAFMGHENFLLRKMEEGNHSARTTFQLRWCIECLGMEPPLSHERFVLPQKGNLDLEGAFYQARMGQSVISDPSKVHGLERSVRTLRDLRMYLFLMGERLSDRSTNMWLKWIASCENPDGGLGFMPGTTSFIENCYYGVRALEILESFPLDPQALISFVLSTKSGRGGFGRRNMGVPFPSSTWHAIGTLKVLRDLLGPEIGP